MISLQLTDNFLTPEEYSEVQELCDSIHFHSAEEYADKYGDSTSPDPKINFNWRGWHNCKRSDNLVDYLDNVTEKINDTFDCEVSRLEFFQHPLENFPEYEESPPQHIDARFEFSGVFYLDNGDIGLGTTVGDQYVQWKPNRLITFDAYTPHNPQFGGIDRKVLTFFAYKKKGVLNMSEESGVDVKKIKELDLTSFVLKD